MSLRLLFAFGSTMLAMMKALKRNNEESNENRWIMGGNINFTKCLKNIEYKLKSSFQEENNDNDKLKDWN